MRSSTPSVPRPGPGRRSTGPVLPVALVASVLVHVLVLGVRFELSTVREGVSDPHRQRSMAIPALRLIDVVPVDGEVAPPTPGDPSPVSLARPAVQPAIPSVDAATTAAAAAGEPDDETAGAGIADRLSPGAADPRLWRPAERTLRATLDPLEDVRARIGAEAVVHNDSIAAGAEAERRAADWTPPGRTGGRWGITPDTVHLGGSKIQLRQCTAGPCPGYLFEPPIHRREEMDERLRIFTESRLQSRRAELEEAFEARVRAIRSQKAATRDTLPGRGGR